MIKVGGIRRDAEPCNNLHFKSIILGTQCDYNFYNTRQGREWNHLRDLIGLIKAVKYFLSFRKPQKLVIVLLDKKYTHTPLKFN